MNQKKEFSEYPTSRIVYINQELLKKLPNVTQPTVLINPKFLNSKPHFNKEFIVNNKIHINPLFHKDNFFSINDSNMVVNSSNSTTQIQTNSEVVCKQEKNQSIIKPNEEKRRAHTLRSKYKIIRRNIENVKLPETTNDRIYQVNTRFKIDRFKNSKDCKKSKQQTNVTKNKYRYVNRNIIVRKDSTNCSSLKTKVKQSNEIVKKTKEKWLNIRGHKYKLSKNCKTLRLVTNSNEIPRINFKSVKIGGITFRRKDRTHFVKVNLPKLKKSNVPCPIYRKYGKCKGKDIGTCIRIHNPNQVSLCPKFIQGACLNDKCLLSHKISAEKMPTCKFFLDGVCTKDGCPYLHVKINAKAEVCKDFLEGFCQLAAECPKRHQFLCPEFEKSGSCSKTKCCYPHLSVEKPTPRNIKLNMRTKILNKTFVKKSLKAKVSKKIDLQKCENDAAPRYYTNNVCEEDLLFTKKRDSSIKSSTDELPSFISL